MKMLVLVLLTVCLGFVCVSGAQEKPVIEKKAVKNNTPKSALKNFLIGLEARQYRYSEPGFVSHTGLLYGAWGEWYWASALGDGKLYGNLLYGNLNYDGALCDLSNNCTPYTSKTADLIAKINTRLEYNLNKSLYFFAGAGFRYLYDRGEGVGFYTRTGNWAYLPLGGGFKYRKIMFDLEYDLIVYGSFKSNLSEVSSTFTDLVHSQKGYGLLVTAGYQINEIWNIQGVYESWNLEESEPIASGGSVFVEPKNNSDSFGLKVGYSF